MTRADHLLWIIAEEAVEVAQRASKAARFGLEECEPGQELNNASRILWEMSHLLAAMEMLMDDNFVFRAANRDHGKDLKIWGSEKKAKVEKYLKHSENCKRLD
jgi:hypothetical protein